MIISCGHSLLPARSTATSVLAGINNRKILIPIETRSFWIADVEKHIFWP